MGKQNKVNKAIYPVVFDLNLIVIPQYRRVLEELIVATEGFSKEGSVLVSLETMDLAEAIERMEGDCSFCVGFFSFFRHMLVMIDTGYHGKSGEIFAERRLRVYFKDYCRLGLEAAE